MIELPETYVLSEQINQILVGKTIKNAVANAHPHTFAWYTGNPAEFEARLGEFPTAIQNLYNNSRALPDG